MSDAAGFTLGRRKRRGSGTGGNDGVVHFRRLVRDEAARRGVDLDAVFWSVFVGLAFAARHGDVAAARLLLERVAVPEDEDHLKALVKGADPLAVHDVEAVDVIDEGPTPPPSTPGVDEDGKVIPSFGEHLVKMVAIAERNGLLSEDELADDESRQAAEDIREEHADWFGEE